MPRADFTGEFSSNAGRSNFPRLKLATSERARVAVVTKPTVEFVHWLEAPKIVNMAPVYKKITDRDQNVQWVPETRFVNRAICPGDFDTLRERGADAAGCDACRMALERPDCFRPAGLRYAVTIIRYNMRPGGGWNDVAAPYGIGALIWAFSGKVFDKLRSFKELGSAYEDIRKVDVLLECTDQNYQKPYSQGDFTPLAPAFWLVNEKIQSYTTQYLEQNCASDEDLDDALGRRLQPDWMADDLRRITQAWDVVRAYEGRQQGSPSVGQGFGAETFQQGMENVRQQYGQQSQGAGSGGGTNAGSQSAGVDRSLLGGGQGSYRQEAGNGSAPLWEPQWQQPNPAVQQEGGERPFLPSATEPAPSTASAMSVPPVTAASSSGPVPEGITGLTEFMAGTTHNPAPTPPPSAPTPAGGHYTFEDLARLGRQQ